MSLSFSSFFSLLMQSFHDWQKDNATVWSASLAYYTIFSLGPLLLLVISIAGIIFTKTSLEKEIATQLQGLLGNEGSKMILAAINGSKKPTSSVMSSVISTFMLLLGASGIFGQLQQMLNKIWHVTPKPKGGLLPFIINRLLNFSMVGIIAFLLLVSLVVNTVLSSIANYLSFLLPQPSLVFETINFSVSFIIITLLFAFVLKVLPDVKIKWENVWIGAIITSLLFNIGKTFIGSYIGHSNVASEYGAAASLIVLLLWVYYSTLILFFGVEFTKVYTLMSGEQIVPSEFAISTNVQSDANKNNDSKETTTLRVIKGFTEGFINEIFTRFSRKKTKTE